MKTCTKCHEEKELTEYYTDDRLPDGRISKCKKCYIKDTTESKKRSCRGPNLTPYYETDRKKLAIYELLINNYMTVSEVCKIINISRSLTFHLMTSMLDNGHLFLTSKRREHDRQTTNVYISTPKPFVPRTDEEIKSMLSTRANNRVPPVKTTIPHARLVLNLDRPGSDYAWQRKKSKSAFSGIGSSWYMYDMVAG